MHERAFRRAVALGVTALLLFTTAAFADSVQPSTDGVTLDAAGNDDLGTFAPGAPVSVDLGFWLVCGGFTHVDPGTTVAVDFVTGTIPPDAVFGGATEALISLPAKDGWPTDGSGCATPAQSVVGAAPSHVTFTAPTVPNTPGTDYSILLMYQASTSKSGALNPTFVFVTLDFSVSADQPPTLQLPDPMTVEGNVTGGATVSYVATATDPEDSPPPTPTCDPASGELFPLGTTVVACTVTDSAGHTVSGSFDVTVVDTTAPVLSGVPSDLSVVTYDPAGAVVTYTSPTAADIVDPAPDVACTPPPGSLFPRGTTTVTCTATDHSGNTSSATFGVTVTYVRLGATFDAPIGPSNVVTVNPGRNLPVKAQVTRDGTVVTSGSVDLALMTCGGTTFGAPIPLALQGDRWVVGLDTSGLTGCVLGVVRLDGHPAGSFEMDASGTSGPAAKPNG